MSSNFSGYAAFDDTIKYFVNDEEEPMHAENDDKCEKEKSNKSSKKSGRKSLCRGPSEETFLTLSHALKAFADQIIYLLSTTKN